MAHNHHHHRRRHGLSHLLTLSAALFFLLSCTEGRMTMREKAEEKITIDPRGDFMITQLISIDGNSFFLSLSLLLLLLLQY